MSRQCQYVDCDGRRCQEEANVILHYNEEHPFDSRYLCNKHWQNDTNPGKHRVEIIL